ncbi:uncharacterized protein LOC128237055 isoform X2 [Mya arenaria]|uniref:uncharacterized protein LOC128237055 isoform X2 n=1 Tax=Mya arenaria TaxID=6604 RepID=UPI0022E95C27|nr:uncharacterized protein LOC128237055 isoform X2 [Mya arenaria]
MKRLGCCHVLIVLLIILTIGIDESEEVSFVVEDRDGNYGTTATVDVDVSTDCDKVFLMVVTGSGQFYYDVATGNTGGAFTTAVDPDSGDEKLQCNMATIRTNAITSYNLSITVTDTGDSTATTKNVTVTVENLVIPRPIACAASTENGIVWPEAPDGHISRNKSCQKGYQGDIYRRCEDGIYLNPVNNCTRRAIQDLHAQVFNGSLNPTEALSKLKQETNNWTAANENLPTTGDLQTLNQILDKVIDDIELNSTTVENVANSFFEVSNNLLDESSTSSWKSLINDKGVGADSVITTIDRFISKVVNSSATVLNMTFDMPNLFAEIGQVDRCEHIMFPSTTSKAKKANNSMEDLIVVGCGLGKQVFSGGLFKNVSGMLPSTSKDIDSFHRQAIETVDVRITFHVF